MASLTIRHTIRPAPGGDGPFYTQTETIVPGITGGTVTNVTLGIANIGAALDQCKTDGTALLAGATVSSIIITTTATTP